MRKDSKYRMYGVLSPVPPVMGDAEGIWMWGTTPCSESDKGCPWGLKQGVIQH